MGEPVFKINAKLLPPKIILYGVHGIGKTTIAAHFPNPVFVRTEDGLGKLQVPSGPVCTSYDDFKAQIRWLMQETHEYQTLVIDSLDWLEKLVHNDIAVRAGVYDISAINYGKGYDIAGREWDQITQRLSYLNSTKGMIIMCLAHSQVKKYEPPNSDSYERYALNLHKKGAAVLSEWCDCLFFVNYDVQVVRTESSFGNQKTKAIGTNMRIVYTTEQPAFMAKNRYGLPSTIAIEEGASEQFWSGMEGYCKPTHTDNETVND